MSGRFTRQFSVHDARNAAVLPAFVDYSEVLVASSHHLRVHDKHSHQLRVILLAEIFADCVMAARHLHKGLSDPIYSGRVPVHTAQHLPLEDMCDNGGSAMPVGRREASGRVSYLEANNGFAWRVL